ncbi:uncharacterized protein LOC107813182 [Nicotiana tabacum]|uniref:uncharacterized protein LOC107813182 n=1 Tax=Nicotiana tabacum TaxID=4097 RepID=UPI003F4E9CAD
MSVKLVVGDCTLNVVSAYAPQAGLDEEAKRHFLGSKARDTNGYKLWYSEVVKGKNEVGILVDRDIIESVVKVRSSAGGYVEVYGGFGFGVRNGGGTSLLQFTKAFELMIANSSFSKREEHLVTFQCIVVKIQIDYFLLIKYDRGLYEDCKVIPGETLATQHRLLVMDVGIIIRRKKRAACSRPRVRWGALTKDKAQKLEGRLSAIGTWKSSGDASAMWMMIANCVGGGEIGVKGLERFLGLTQR